MAIAITRNDRFKRGYARYIGYSILIAAAVHLLFFCFSPPFVFKPYALPDEENTVVISLPDRVEAPPEPTAVRHPIVEIVPAGDGEEVEDVDIPQNVFDNLGSFPPLAGIEQERAPRFVAFDELPVLIRSASPAYPELARQAGIEGRVLLDVVVGADGAVQGASVLESDVTSAMEKAAIAAALQFRFRPAMQGAVPVRVRVAIRITFELN